MTGFYRNMATGDYDEYRDTEDVQSQQHKKKTSRKRNLTPKGGSHRMIFAPSAMMITTTELAESPNS